MDVDQFIDHKKTQAIFSEEIAAHLKNFFRDYVKAGKENGWDEAALGRIFLSYVEQVAKEHVRPYPFLTYHQKILAPFNYYELGINFMRPLVDEKSSFYLGTDTLDSIQSQLNAKENAVFFGNHQIEPDPQLMALLLRENYPKLAEEMIFVAGHRVTTDPLATPISKGTNMLCIFSKKYLDDLPEKKMERIQHNQKTMKQMGQLLAEGGKCIYVAPSGGRDRPGASGEVEVAPFDAASIEMFYLIAKHAKTPTHFYPLSLSSYSLLPPPDRIFQDLGERREPKKAPIALWFGEEIEMEKEATEDLLSRQEKRQLRADLIYEEVKKGYEILKKRIKELQ